MAELEATAPEIDEIVAERFGDLRNAIAEHLRTGRNIDEVRFLLRRYFESFVVRDDEGGRAIVANLRPDVVDDVMADLAGAKREALRGLTQQLAFYMGYCPHRRKGHVSGGTRDGRTLASAAGVSGSATRRSQPGDSDSAAGGRSAVIAAAQMH